MKFNLNIQFEVERCPKGEKPQIEQPAQRVSVETLSPEVIAELVKRAQRGDFEKSSSAGAFTYMGERQ